MQIRCLIVAALIALLPSITSAQSKAPPSEPLTKAGALALQECLNSRGFDAGVPDGVIGKKTITASIEFQEAIFESRGLTGKREVTQYPNKMVGDGCKLAIGFKNPNTDSAKAEAKERAKKWVTEGSIPAVFSEKNVQLRWFTAQPKLTLGSQIGGYSVYLQVLDIFETDGKNKRMDGKPGQCFANSKDKNEVCTGARSSRVYPETNIKTLTFECENGDVDTVKFPSTWTSKGFHMQVKLSEICPAKYPPISLKTN